MFAVTGTAWWAGVIVLLTFFPGSIMPWQRYCEAVVAFAQARRGRPRRPRRRDGPLQLLRLGAGGGAAHVGAPHRALTQTIGFPGYFVTLLICTILDVAGATRLSVRGTAVPYLLVWLAVRAVHSTLAALKSVRVYGRRLATLR